jgi:hypothetical protein
MRALRAALSRASCLAADFSPANQTPEWCLGIEVTSLRADLAEAVGFAGRRVDLVVRFGYAPDLPFSLRRPVSAVLQP